MEEGLIGEIVNRATLGHYINIRKLPRDLLGLLRRNVHTYIHTHIYNMYVDIYISIDTHM